MKTSTPLIRVVTDAVLLGAYESKSVPEFKLILFLAMRNTGDWTVGGKFDSIADGLAWRVSTPPRTVEWALAKLIKKGVVLAVRHGHSTTYALTTRFREWCQALHDVRHDQAAVTFLLSQRGTAMGCGDGPQPIALVDRNPLRSPYREQEESQKRATADAAPAVPAGEGDDMSDYPTDDGFGPTKKKPSGWGGKSEGTPLGGEDKPAAGRTVRGPDPRSKAVRDVRHAFEQRLLPISVTKRVPLYGRVNKMQANIKFMLDQGHDLAVITGAFDYFASQADSLVFMGDSLWDIFFARRDEAIRIATINAIGSHGGPQESLADKGRRQASRKEQS